MALSTAFFSFSQDPIKADRYSAATISANFGLVLDVSTELVEYYKADAAGLNWTSEIEAKKQCGFHSNNLVTFYPDYANKKILIQIHLDRTNEPKDIIWWNAYLQSLTN